VKILPPEWKKFRDSRTGRELWQITSAPCKNEAVYFECQGFSAGSRHLLFQSNRSGQTELFRADLESGELCQLTENSGEMEYSLNVHPDGRHFYYTGHDAVWRVDIATGGQERVFANEGRYPGLLWGYPLSFSGDGRLAAVAVMDRGRMTPIPSGIGARDGPDCRLILVDLFTGDHRLVCHWPTGFSHPMICPGDDNLITFVPNGNLCWNMDLPREERVRMFRVDARTGKVTPCLCPPRFRTLTHESWSPDGERLFFFDKNAGEWTPVTVASMKRDGTDWRAHFTSYEHRLGHGVCSPDGRFFVADVQNKHHSPLFLIDLQSGREEILCWPDASNEGGHAAAAHVHPSFSRDGRFITYTSDRGGHPQVHVLPFDPDSEVRKRPSALFRTSETPSQESERP
jgi:Tol biopolymer transport system component